MTIQKYQSFFQGVHNLSDEHFYDYAEYKLLFFYLVEARFVVHY
jgi:hypothetical protein